MTAISPRDALPPTITTARLTLRAPALADLPQLVALANNSDVVATTASLPHPYTEDHGRSFIERFSIGLANRPFAIVNTASQFMGIIGLKFAEDRAPELGYWLGQPFWGQGYVSEATAGLLQAARRTGLFPRIGARVLAENPASIRVLEKSGFRVTEHTRSVVERHRGKPLLIMEWQDQSDTTLRTERLILRHPIAGDARPYAEGVGNYAVSHFLTPVPHPYTEAMAEDWLAKSPRSTPERAQFMIDLPDAGLIGAISLGNELGFWLNQQYWGRGYMTEAAAALVTWHFASTDSQSVLSGAHIDNPASLAVQTKLGFVETGRKMGFSQSRQRDIEHVVTTLTRSAFEERRQRL